MPSVFISYAHESTEHREGVLELARALLQAGWEVRLDRFTGYPTGGWPRWMADQIEAADRILCICTRTYRARFDVSGKPGASSGDGRGSVKSRG